MNELLIKNVTIIDKQSIYHMETADVLIADGLISKIGNISAIDNIQIVDGSGQYLSGGFFDLNVNIGEPGLETKEDIDSGCKAAAAGGFTGLALMPNTHPAVHSKNDVTYLVNRSKDCLVDLFPLGSISQNREGKELAELYDMKLAGAVAFTDGDRPLADAGLMSRALLYSKGFGGLIMSYAEDKNIAAGGKMNEGINSTLLGMKGNPALAEELMISRDLYLAEYNDAPIHFSTVSSAKSVDLIRQARKKGIRVTCDVAAHHLVFTDDQLSGFDSMYKVKPPLRIAEDVKALITGLNDGTIDAIVSQHTPHEVEFKNVEFEIAYYGIIGLQTLLPMALKAGLSIEMLIDKLVINPRRILNLPIPEIAEGKPANLVMFDPKASWEFNSAANYSKSANSPWLNQNITGKVSLVVNNSKIFLS
jgi:dihydroorotase